MKIALGQYSILWENKEKNKEKVKRILDKLKGKSVDILFLPEMSLTGFSMNTEITKDKNQETIEFFKKLTKIYGIAIGFGWVEKNEKRAQNHYTVISSEGKILSDFVKIHPFSFGNETDYFEGGSKLVKYQIKDFIISNFICYDLRFPEIFQAISKETDLIVIAANWPERRSEHWKALLKARAIENQVFIAGINCVGNIEELNYSGDSSIYSPEGELLVERSNVEDIIIIDLEKSKVDNYRKNFPLKDDRKIELYKKLL